MFRCTRRAILAIVFVSGAPGTTALVAPPASHPSVPKPTGAVTALAFSPNGRVLAVGRYRSVTLLDVPGGRVARTLPGMEGAVTSIVFANNGATVAAGSGTPGKDGQIAFWETATGRRVRSLAAHTDLIYGIALRPDGRQMAAVSYDHLVSLWSLGGSQSAAPRYLRDHTDSVYGVAYSPNGLQVATAAADRTVKVWDTDTGKRLVTFSEAAADQYAVAYRPGGAQIAAGGVDKTLRVWNVDAAGGTLARSAFAHDGAILRVLYAQNGKSIFTCGEDNAVKEWDADTLAERAVYPKQPDWPQSLALSPNDRLLAVGRHDGTMALYDTATHRPAAMVPARVASRVRVIEAGLAADHGYGHERGLFTNRATGTEAHPISTMFVNKPGEFLGSRRHNRPRAPGLRGRSVEGSSAKADTVSSPGEDFSPTPRAANVTKRIRSRRIGSPLQGWVGIVAGVPGALPQATVQAAPSGRTSPLAMTWNGAETAFSERASPHPSPFTLHSTHFTLHTSHFINHFLTSSPHHAVTPSHHLALTSSPHHLITSSSADPADADLKQQSGNETAAAAQAIAVPSVVSGVLWNGKAGGKAPAHYYRFPAKRGEPLVVDVMARRAGSPLDSELEILDLQGKPIERAVVRAVSQTELTLRDADSVAPGIRLLVKPDFGMKDYVLIGREVIQIYNLTKGPDDDYPFRSLRGQRLGFFGTTPEYHTNGSMAYKVEVHPPGSTFSPNGMPLTHLFYKNDDGGPLYGRDSYLEFTPPADGEYLVRVTDVRGQQGEKFTYKMRVHPPRPDFNILFNPSAVSVPKDGAMVASLECERREGFDGEIAVHVEGLPTGFSATTAAIEARETAAALSMSVAPGTENPKPDSPSTYRVVATATINGREVSHVIEPDNKGRRVSVGAESKVQVVTDVREAELRPGGEVVVEARITRLNGFKGRVPLDVRNLPYGVKVDDVGLNGILVTENDTTRKFVLRAEPWVKPQTRLFYVTANVEGGVSNTAAPLTLRIRGL